MYQPSHFVESRSDELLALIRDHPLGTVVTGGADGLSADPIPLIHVPLEGSLGVLRGHVARANPLWRRAGAGGIDCLVVFNGPSGYVSPSWYPTKAQTHKVVPTFNYAVVQARGTLVAHDDAGWLDGLVAELTRRHEAGRAQPWAPSDAPRDYIEAMLKAIVGIELTIGELVGKFKLSQNRSAADLGGVVEGLAGESGAQPAALRALMTREPGR